MVYYGCEMKNYICWISVRCLKQNSLRLCDEKLWLMDGCQMSETIHLRLCDEKQLQDWCQMTY
jgi:hypothetical protein